MRGRYITSPTDRIDAAVRELVEALREEVQAEVRARTAAPPRLLSIAEAAAACGLSRSTFYGLIGKGEVRSISIGRRRLIPESALREFMDGGRET
jgi:excisionase family DNA binding protein